MTTEQPRVHPDAPQGIVRIFDTTLRDGEQSPGATMNSAEKLEVARQLSVLGVDVIEAGFPAASPDDLEAVRRIAQEVGKKDGPIIAGLARCWRDDIDKAWQGVREASKPRIHTFLATSDLHMERKLGMTRVFGDDGRVVPVTVIGATPNTVTRLRSAEQDGYTAVQLGAGTARRVTKPVAGQFKELPKEQQRPAAVREFRIGADEAYEVGQQLDVSLFEAGDLVDVVGVSKGHGFTGTIARHNFKRGPVTHGSHNVRKPGSIGASAYPSRVFKGMRMAGRMGGKRVTQVGLVVHDVDVEMAEPFDHGPGANGEVLQRSLEGRRLERLTRRRPEKVVEKPQHPRAVFPERRGNRPLLGGPRLQLGRPTQGLGPAIKHWRLPNGPGQGEP